MFLFFLQSNNEDVADCQVRFQGYRFLLSLRPDNADHVAMASGLLDALLVEDRLTSGQKARHFSNSHGHRFKHRLWVGVIILQVMFLDFYGWNVIIYGQLLQDLGLPGREDDIMAAALTGLIDDNPQPSVRFLQEWSIVRILYKHQRLEQVFWKTMDTAVEQRAGSMVSFLAIACQTARALSSMPERLQFFVSKVFNMQLPLNIFY